jgi:branched-chain amino acid transport system permease protein
MLKKFPLLPEMIVFAALCALPLLGGSFMIDLASKFMVIAVLALSLELLVGTTGLISLGHAAYFGIGAYTAYGVSNYYPAANLFVTLVGSLLTSGVFALVTGALALRTRGVYFIMVTLAFAQMAYFVFHDTKLGGGSDGAYLPSRPSVSIGNWEILNLNNPISFYCLALLILGAVYILLRLIIRSRFGHALSGIGENEQRMRAAGFSTYSYKLTAFVLTGMLAGLGGALLAIRDGYVNPELLSWHQSAAFLVMIILGGLGSLRGAFIGALAFLGIQEALQYEPITGFLSERWKLILGLVIIACVAKMPNGLIGVSRQLRMRKTRKLQLAHREAT